MRIVSLLLILVSVFLNFKHGWDAFQPATPAQAKMMAITGISKAVMPWFGAFSIMTGLMLLFPQAFFCSNVLQAITIVIIMALSLRAGDYKTALLEIPFLTMPLLLIWLKYPFKF